MCAIAHAMRKSTDRAWGASRHADDEPLFSDLRLSPPCPAHTLTDCLNASTPRGIDHLARSRNGPGRQLLRPLIGQPTVPDKGSPACTSGRYETQFPCVHIRLPDRRERCQPTMLSCRWTPRPPPSARWWDRVSPITAGDLARDSVLPVMIFRQVRPPRSWAARLDTEDSRSRRQTAGEWVTTSAGRRSVRASSRRRSPGHRDEFSSTTGFQDSAIREHRRVIGYPAEG